MLPTINILPASARHTHAEKEQASYFSAQTRERSG